MSTLISPASVKENLLIDFRILVEKFSTLGIKVKYKPKAAICNCWTNEETSADNLNTN